MRPMLSVLVLFALVDSADAGIRKFPYQAVVAVDEAVVHSGPGRRYYETGRIPRGARVTVHRHDPGGWYMISPPEGSFSLVRADAVDCPSGNIGVLTRSNVSALVGASGSNDRDVEQVRLSKGGRVEILGEQTIQRDGRAVRMLKIRPPMGEYRWASGRNLVPEGAHARLQNDSNPYAYPSNAKRDVEPIACAVPNRADRETVAAEAATHVETQADPFSTDAPDSSGGTTGPLLTAPGSDSTGATGPMLSASTNSTTVVAPATELNRLIAIDDAFRSMIAEDPSSWNFADIEAEYLRLNQGARKGLTKRQLVQRFAAVEKYKQIKADYDAFNGILDETAEQDAQLASLQREQMSQAAAAINPEEASSAPETNAVPTPDAALQPIPDGAIIAPTVAPYQVQAPHAAGRPVHPGAAYQYRHGAHGSRHQMQGAQWRGRGYAPAPHTQVVPQAAPQQVPHPATQTVPQAVPQFDGAGVIQKMRQPIPGAPQHILTTPDGRVLAFLQPQRGINLDVHVGQAMGVTGSRSHRRDLRGDLIHVQNLTRVRLAQ